MHTDLSENAQKGLWVPCYYGNWFKICRLLKDRRRTQETSADKWKTLAEAQAVADKKNRRK